MTDPRSSFTLFPDRLTDRPYWVGHIPFVMWLVGEVQPRVIVELGTETGVSLAAICQAVQHWQISTKVYGVDTWEGDINTGPYDSSVYRELSDYLEQKNYGFVELVRTTFDEAVSKFEDGCIDILHIDGCHTYDAVKHDFETWQAKVSRRGIVMFHDIAVFKDDFGAGKFWSEVKGKFPNFEFAHSNGLGVLLVGPDQPISLQRLAQTEGMKGVTLPPRAVLSIFEALGGRIGHQVEADMKVHEYEKAYVDLQTSLVALHSNLNDEHKKAAHAMALLRIEHDLLQNERQFRQQVLTSLSWRVTAPLRELKTFLRRVLRVSRRVASRYVLR